MMSPFGTARPPHEFRIDPETGSVWAAGGIEEGLHAFNVSVTDGKYSSVSYVQITVSGVFFLSLEMFETNITFKKLFFKELVKYEISLVLIAIFLCDLLSI